MAKKAVRRDTGRRRFTEEFKQEAAQLLLDGYSAASVAERLGLARTNLLYRWKQQQLARNRPYGSAAWGEAARPAAHHAPRRPPHGPQTKQLAASQVRFFSFDSCDFSQVGFNGGGGLEIWPPIWPPFHGLTGRFFREFSYLAALRRFVANLASAPRVLTGKGSYLLAIET